MPLGGQMQLWWDLNTTHLNYALVGYVADDEYIAFGPALPGAIDRLMGYANAIAGGVNSSSGLAWATDMFMSAYIPCDTTFSPPVGVCPVSSFLSPEQQSTEFNPLIAASRMNGITTLVLSRPLANTSQYTNPINVTSSSFIWAHGPISSGDGPPSYRLAQHGVGPNDYSPLTKLSLASGTIEGSNASFLGACPPLLV
ncbi:hypothetical protein CEUSTIGMA_g12892.t1 [Chlamydomonas eustigma]|uniref:DOMON domain-containing protein n=1 Tax=Chlamydomonas eustigma TaxID=1157962 RepID=A0A250XR01_9CHLO|nr:hypothetical protein CEUSTIGMA_g12892.t1 [Chlamydomonas eustigma]|eukprot:GAX85476.1 hypothetical protein CEUSTIGMA_g12892.t1 [Chlamydomonas eustigma]